MKDFGIVVALWVGVGIAGLLAAWFSVSTIVQVIRGKIKPWQKDALIAIFFHAVLAMAALFLANQAVSFAEVIK